MRYSEFVIKLPFIDKGDIKLYGDLEKLRREMGHREVVIETVITSEEQSKFLMTLYQS